MGMKKSERSRVHAKQRRLLEAKEIADITEQLPIPDRLKSKLDKASILRLAITFMRLKQCVGEDKNAKWATGMVGNGSEAKLLLETLGGFFVMVSANMEVLYVSENVEKHLGIKQVDMISSTFLDYVFAKDQAEVLKQFQLLPRKSDEVIHGVGLAGDATGNPVEMDITYASCQAGWQQLQYDSRRRFFIHMKCVYSQKNASSSITASTEHMLLQCVGYLHLTRSLAPNFLAAVCRPLQPTPIMELRMDGNMFLSRHSLDMRFIYCDPRLSTIFGYEPDEVIGQSMYNYHHPADLVACSDCHSNVMTTGASMSKYYRFLGKSNEWFWLQTRATVVYNASKYPQYIVCMNYIVSEKEGKRYLEERLKQSSSSKTGAAAPPLASSECSSSITGGVGCISTNPGSGGGQQPTSVVGSSRSTTTSGVSSNTSSELVLHSTSSPFVVSSDELERDASMMSLTSNVSDLTLCKMDLLEDESGRHRHSANPVISIQQQPQFYIDTRGEPIVEEPQSDYPRCPSSGPAVDSATSTSDPLGNLWLSVHAITDPMASPLHTSELYPTEFAEELEDMSFAHCSKLMRESTEAALRAYAVDGDSSSAGSAGHGSGGGVSAAVPGSSSSEWEACLAALDRQANRLYSAMYGDGFKPNRRSQSSASIAAMSTATSQSYSEGGRASVVSSAGTTMSSGQRSSSYGRQSSNATPMSSVAPLSPLPDATSATVIVAAGGAAHPSMQSLTASEGFSPSPQLLNISASPRTAPPHRAAAAAGEDGGGDLAGHGDLREMEQQWSAQAGSTSGDSSAFSPEEMQAIDEMLSDYPDLLSAGEPLPLPLPPLFDIMVDPHLPASDAHPGLQPSLDGGMSLVPQAAAELPPYAQATYPHDMIVDVSSALSPGAAGIGSGLAPELAAYAKLPGQTLSPPLLRPSILEQLLVGSTAGSGTVYRGTAIDGSSSAPDEGTRQQPLLLLSETVAPRPSFASHVSEEPAATLPWNPMSGIQLYDPDEFLSWCDDDSKLQ